MVIQVKNARRMTGRQGDIRSVKSSDKVVNHDSTSPTASNVDK